MSAFLFLEKIDEQTAKVVGIHNFPDMLTEEDKQGGVLVEAYNEPPMQEGKIVLPYWNYKTNEVFFELVDIPISETEQLRQRVEMQEQAITELSIYIATLGI